MGRSGDEKTARKTPKKQRGDRQTDRPTDRQTLRLIELLSQLKTSSTSTEKKIMDPIKSFVKEILILQ